MIFKISTKKFLLISFVLSLLGCTKLDNIQEEDKQGKSIGNLVRKDLVVKMPNYSAQINLTKSQNQSSLRPIWDSAFTVVTKSGTHILVPLHVDKSLRLLSFTNSLKKTYSNSIRGYLAFKGIQTKGDGDDDPTVIMVGDDELSSDGMYTGVFTYSEPNGDVSYSCVFENSTLKYLIVPDSLQGTTPNFYKDTTVNISLLLEEDEWNLSIDGGAVCVALRPTIDFTLNRYVLPHTQHITTFWSMMMPDHLAGGSSNEEQRMESDITISLVAGPGGRVSGGGKYPPSHTSFSISATPDKGYKFDKWTGDFAGKPQEFSIPLTHNMSGTALFKKLSICMDLINGKSNPLPIMTLAPPVKYDLNTALWGNTRAQYGNSSFHYGIDLHGEVGDPVYAMFEGEIDGAPFVYQQPNRIDKKLPSGYNGDIDKAGNRMYVTSIVNGNVIRVGYWHLQAGNAIAINPRTGAKFQPGEKVYPGDIIGYIGITGNANNNVPHLHLFTSINGVPTDPMIILNVIFDPNNLKLLTPCGY